MKKLISAIVLSLLSYGAIADDHAPSIGGIETYSCKFNEGNDLDDVLSVAKKWNKFASKNFPCLIRVTCSLLIIEMPKLSITFIGLGCLPPLKRKVRLLTNG